MENLDDIVLAAETEIVSASDDRALDNVRVQYLGKKGALTQL